MTTIVLKVPNDSTPLDLLLFRRFGREVAGLVEATLALPANYGLAALGPCPPAGTAVTVEVPAAATSVATKPVITLFS